MTKKGTLTFMPLSLMTKAEACPARVVSGTVDRGIVEEPKAN
jgi:hypothetical protein